MRVVDLSGAWRLHEDSNRAVYGLSDDDTALGAAIQAEAVYGSPELHGPAIARARLVANPGCYATSIILAHFMYAADNLSAYAVFGHRHLGELLEQLGVNNTQIGFTPHLLPIPRGILSTVYVPLAEKTSAAAIQACFDTFYAGAPLVRVRRSPTLPQIQHVVRGPFCDIGFAVAPDRKRLVVVSCLDNLLKGAASQAIENMNLMLGWPETEGLL